MKKVFSLIAVAVMVTMVSCGPSAEEKAKMEEDAKRMTDSIAALATEAMEPAMEAEVAPADSATAEAPAAEAPAAEEHAH